MKKLLLLIATLFLFTGCSELPFNNRPTVDGTRWKYFEVTPHGSYTSVIYFYYNTFVIEELEVVDLETYRYKTDGTYYYRYPLVEMIMPDQDGYPITIDAEVSPDLIELHFDGLIYIRQ